MSEAGSGEAKSYFARVAANTAASFQRLRKTHRISRREARAQFRRRWLIAALVVGGAVLTSMFLFDLAATRRVADLPGWVVMFFRKFTHLGWSGVFLWPLAVLLLFCALISARRITSFQQGVLAAVVVRLQFLLAAIGLTGLVVAIVKRLIGRSRPYAGELDAFHYVPFAWKNIYASMPSGHTAAAFSALVAFGALWPRALPILWVYAIGMGASRVITYSHHVSDAIAGAFVGMLGAMLVREYFAARGLIFGTDAGGTLRAGPGPSSARIRQVLRSAIRG